MTNLTRTPEKLKSYALNLGFFLFLIILGRMAVIFPAGLWVAPIGGIAILAVLGIKPHWCLMALLLLRSSLDFARNAAYFVFGGFVFNIVGLLNIVGMLLAFYFLARRFARGDRLLPTLPLKAYGLFVVAVLLSVLTSPGDFTLGIKAWARFTGALGIALLASEIAHNEKLVRYILRVILVATFPPVILGIYQALTGGGRFFAGYVATSFAYRASGTFDHPATLGSFLIIPATLAMAAFVLHHNLLPRWSALPFVGLCLVVLLLTFARSEWIGGFIALVLIAALRYRRLLILGAIAGAILLTIPTIQERIGGDLATDSLSWRQEVWGANLYLLREPRAFGMGPDSSPELLNNILPHVVSPPHNDYLRVTLELGVVGMVAYAAVLLSLLWRGWHDYRHGDSTAQLLGLTIFAVTLSSLVISYTDNYLSYASVQWYLWGLIGLLASSRLRG